METNISQSIDQINHMYNNLSYFDIYGGSVLFFVMITLIVFLWSTYFSLMINAASIKDDWVNQRCNPKVMPFAGFINKPDNKTITEFTGENFSYCTQTILSNITGTMVQPFQYLTNFLLSIFQGFLDDINQIRNVFNTLRNNMRDIAENVLHRILNVMIPLQQMFIALMDSLQKAQGVLAGSLFTALGSYYTLKSLMGAIVELIVRILIILVSIIVGLWAIPITWPAAASMSAIFLAISIPLAIIVAVLTDVMHITSSRIPKLKCFDPNTELSVSFSNETKSIKNIKIGERLQGNNTILGKILLSSDNEDMYHYKGIIVSGSHRVLENNEWIYIKDSRFSKIYLNYPYPYIYCLITANKRINIQNVEMLDWDEVIDNKKQTIESIQLIEQKQQVMRYGGFSHKCFIKLKNDSIITIKNIIPGDILKNGEIVYGVVELDSNIIQSCHKINLGNFTFYGEKNIDYMFLKSVPNTISLVEEPNPPSKIYHLLTSTGSFSIENIPFRDYNYMSEDILPP